MAVSFFKQDKGSVIYRKFYSPVSSFTSVRMGTQFAFLIFVITVCHLYVPLLHTDYLLLQI